MAFSASSLNVHENLREKPSTWIPVAYFPNYDDSKSKLTKKRGAESIPARRIRLYQDCWRVFLAEWNRQSESAEELLWADGVRRLTRMFLGGIMGDQQEADKYTCEPCACHRCHVKRSDFIDTTHASELKITRRRRREIMDAAAGGDRHDPRPVLTVVISIELC
jgi:hypothetical protein